MGAYNALSLPVTTPASEGRLLAASSEYSKPLISGGSVTESILRNLDFVQNTHVIDSLLLPIIVDFRDASLLLVGPKNRH